MFFLFVPKQQISTQLSLGVGGSFWFDIELPKEIYPGRQKKAKHKQNT